MSLDNFRRLAGLTDVRQFCEADDWKKRAEHHAKEVANITAKLTKWAGVSPTAGGLSAGARMKLQKELAKHQVALAAAQTGRDPTKSELDSAMKGAEALPEVPKALKPVKAGADLELTDKELEVLKHTGHSGGHQSPEVKSLLAKGLLQMDPDHMWPKRTPSNSWTVSDAGHEYLAKMAGGNVAEQLSAVKAALNNKKTKTGGRLKFNGQSAAPYVSVDFEPEHRQRLDHYGTSTQDDGEEQEGWDDEGWEQDYAGPLRKEVEALLKAADLKDWVVDIGEKGFVYVQLPKKGKAS